MGIKKTKHIITLDGVHHPIVIHKAKANNPWLLDIEWDPGLMYVKSGSEMGSLFNTVSWNWSNSSKAILRHSEKNKCKKLISDILLLSEIILKHFMQDKLILMAHSRASLLVIQAAMQKPYLFHAFVGKNQQTSTHINDLGGYERAVRFSKKLGEKRKIRQLQKMGPPPYTQAGAKKQSHLNRLLMDLNVHPGFIPKHIGIQALFNRLKDTGDAALYHSLGEIDLVRSAPRIDIPVYFLMGRYDLVCLPELTRAYFVHLEAAAKTLIWFERSTHYPHFQEKEKYLDILQQIKLRVLNSS